jgi:hypothetical protein
MLAGSKQFSSILSIVCLHACNTDDEDVASQSSFGSRADLGGEEGPLPAWLQVQLPVLVLHAQGDNSTGVVQYVGPTDFASGTWVGVELDNPEGRWRITLCSFTRFGFCLSVLL